MCLAVAEIARYETPDHNGETRRQRNERFGREDLSPEPVRPDPDWLHLWEWWSDLASDRPQGVNGPGSLSNSEIKAWIELTAEPVTRSDIAILKTVDRAYLRALSEELSAHEQRRQEERGQ